MAQARLSRRERLKETQRNAIIEAAEAVFAEQGFHKAKMEDIAKRADFATGSLYNYFRSKNAIFAALWHKRISMLYDRLIEALDDRLSFTELIQRLAAVHLSFMDRHRSFFDIFLAVGHRTSLPSPWAWEKKRSCNTIDTSNSWNTSSKRASQKGCSDQSMCRPRPRRSWQQ